MSTAVAPPEHRSGRDHGPAGQDAPGSRAGSPGRYHELCRPVVDHRFRKILDSMQSIFLLSFFFNQEKDWIACHRDKKEEG